LVRAQDVGLSGVEDPVVLEWAATENRVLLTNDKRTMIAFALDWVTRGLPMPGVFLLRPGTSNTEAIDCIAMFALESDMADWVNAVHRLP
jgi:hypothetical protein